MGIAEQLHRSAAHHPGFEPNCPVCLKRDGISGIIDHLTKCAKQNEADAKAESGWTAAASFTRHPMDSGARAVAAEQRRMLGILKMYRMHCANQFVVTDSYDDRIAARDAARTATKEPKP